MSRLAGVVEALPDQYRSEALRSLAGATYLGDDSKATRELGIEHRAFEEGLREYPEWEGDRTA